MTINSGHGLLQGLTMLCSAPTNGAEVVAKRLQKIARAQSIHLSPSPSEQGLAGMTGSPRRAGRAERAGSVRLRDAIVWGYMMQRPDARTKVGASSNVILSCLTNIFKREPRHGLCCKSLMITDRYNDGQICCAALSPSLSCQIQARPANGNVYLYARRRCQNGTQQALCLRTSRPPPSSGIWRGCTWRDRSLNRGSLMRRQQVPRSWSTGRSSAAASACRSAKTRCASRYAVSLLYRLPLLQESTCQASVSRYLLV